MTRTLERILSRVQKPGRYTGGEYGEVRKDPAQVDFRFALCFPDTYEIGMSNLGLRILYGVLNGMEGVWCQRAFAPWGDMEAEMRAAGLPLFALESGESLREFDVIGFSLGYEMAYTNVLNMLDLAGLPVRAADRGEDAPLIVAGGTCAYNPEPLAPFIDVFSLGEGEEALPELVELIRRGRQAGWSRKELLREIAGLRGFYVPSLYEVTYHGDGTVAAIEPREGAPFPVTKRIVADLDHSYFPVDTMVPSTEIVQDRATAELFRGCIRGCRFCQAGYVYRPVRAKSEAVAARQALESCRRSGYEEMTLSSLSTSDYRPLVDLCDHLLEYCGPRKINLGLPSLRADNFSMGLMQRLQSGRKSGLTFAPEAGTQRLRDAINKNVTEEDLLNSCRTAFEGGWNAVKLYFMLGLPTETDEDVLGIADLARKVLYTFKKYGTNKARGVRITVSTSCFVPKCHTPFQWEGQVDMDEYRRRVELLRGAMRERAITYNWHDPETSLLEAVFARGDRRLADVIEHAWRAGARFDSWTEYFSMERWLDAFREVGLDPAFYAGRQRSREEILPWSVTDVGVRQDYLWREREQAYRALITPDCRKQCTGCGANSFLKGGKCDE